MVATWKMSFAVTIFVVSSVGATTLHNDSELLQLFRRKDAKEQSQLNQLHVEDQKLEPSFQTEERALLTGNCARHPVPQIMNECDVFTFYSPNFPKRYWNLINCRWLLVGSNPYIRFRIQCSTFKLQKRHSGYCKDFLQFGDRKSRYCHREITSDFEWSSAGGPLEIWFRTSRKNKFPGFCCTATAFACGVPNYGMRSPVRFIDGSTTFENEYPWQVALVTPGTFDFGDLYCGASIINKRWILTAARCNVQITHQVLIGAHDLFFPNSFTRRINIIEVCVHPDFNSTGIDEYDITLVKLAEDLDFTEAGLGAVCLPRVGSNADYADWNATATGWGLVQYFPTMIHPDKLQEVELGVISNSICEQAPNAPVIATTMLCAGMADGSHAGCMRDYGGPLSIQNNNIYTEIGVTLFGSHCGLGLFRYTLFTRVSVHMTWITEKAGRVFHAP